MKKIMIVCSTSFYNKVDDIKNKLEQKGYQIELPNCYDAPVTNEDNTKMTEEEYNAFFRQMYIESREKVASVDEIIVLNFSKEKNGVIHENYIGASTFLEMYEAFMQGKKIYIFNGLPSKKDNMMYDEIKGFNPILLNGNIDNIM